MPDQFRTNFYVTSDSTPPSATNIPALVVDRGVTRLTLQSCTMGIMGVPQCEFTEERAPNLSGSYSSGQWIICEIVDVTLSLSHIIFMGQIVSRHTVNIGSGVINVGYKSIGYRWIANTIVATNTDYSGRVLYNLGPLDKAFVWNLSALTLGEIIFDFLSIHSSWLSQLQIVPPNDPRLDNTSVLAQDWASIIPQEPVSMQGRIFDAIDDLLTNYTANIQMFLDDSQWFTTHKVFIRFVDTTILPSTTLTLDKDPIKVELVGDTQNSYTATALRGMGVILPQHLRWLASGAYGPGGTPGMVKGWTPSQEASWLLSDYLNPPNSSAGNVLAIPNSEQLYIHPTSGITAWTRNTDGTWHVINNGVAQTWPSTGASNNFFSQFEVWVKFNVNATLPPSLGNVIGATATASFSALCEVIDSVYYPTDVYQGGVLLYAAGTAIISLAPQLAQPWITGMTYQIRPGPTQYSHVWRRWDIPFSINGVPNDFAYHLTKAFMNGQSAPWAPIALSGAVVVGTTVPQSYVVCGGTGQELSFHVVQSEDGINAGYILFDQPVFYLWNLSGTQLTAMSANPVNYAGMNMPESVETLVPVATGPLIAIWPPPNYDSSGNFASYNWDGTAYTKYGIQRLYVKTYYSWITQGQSTHMQFLAQNVARSHQDEVLDVNITYYGVPWELMTLGMSVNIAREVCPGDPPNLTGWETANVPVRMITLTWPAEAGSLQVVEIHANNQRRAYLGDRHYLHPLWRRDNVMVAAMEQAQYTVGTAVMMGYGSDALRGPALSIEAREDLVDAQNLASSTGKSEAVENWMKGIDQELWQPKAYTETEEKFDKAEMFLNRRKRWYDEGMSGMPEDLEWMHNRAMAQANMRIFGQAGGEFYNRLSMIKNAGFEVGPSFMNLERMHTSAMAQMNNQIFGQAGGAFYNQLGMLGGAMATGPTLGGWPQAEPMGQPQGLNVQGMNMNQLGQPQEGQPQEGQPRAGPMPPWDMKPGAAPGVPPVQRPVGVPARPQPRRPTPREKAIEIGGPNEAAQANKQANEQAAQPRKRGRKDAPPGFHQAIGLPTKPRTIKPDSPPPIPDAPGWQERKAAQAAEEARREAEVAEREAKIRRELGLGP